MTEVTFVFTRREPAQYWYDTEKNASSSSGMFRLCLVGLQSRKFPQLSFVLPDRLNSQGNQHLVTEA